MKKITVSVLVPCLNEEKTIGRVLKDIKSNAISEFIEKYEIIVSDNGSVDRSRQIIENHKGVRIVKCPIKGYGAALHWGIMKASGKYIIYADADLSYPFSNIPKFYKTLKYDPDLVLGTRIKGQISRGAMPFLHRYIGTPLLTLLIRIIYGIRTSDCNSGMRMVKKSFYRKLNMRNSGMEWASELLIKTAIKKGVYMEVPIKFNKDKRGRHPHLSTWADGWRHLKAIMLMRPLSLLIIMPFFVLISIMLYKVSFAFTFMGLIISLILMLSYLTLKLLESVIEKRKNPISEFLLEFKIVQLTLGLTFVGFFLIAIISDIHLGTKLIIASILGITYIWVFLVETIKTHLANRLPDL